MGTLGPPRLNAYKVYAPGMTFSIIILKGLMPFQVLGVWAFGQAEGGEQDRKKIPQPLETERHC